MDASTVSTTLEQQKQTVSQTCRFFSETLHGATGAENGALSADFKSTG